MNFNLYTLSSVKKIHIHHQSVIIVTSLKIYDFKYKTSKVTNIRVY
jgi:hypothetical protein